MDGPRLLDLRDEFDVGRFAELQSSFQLWLNLVYLFVIKATVTHVDFLHGLAGWLEVKGQLTNVLIR